MAVVYNKSAKRIYQVSSTWSNFFLTVLTSKNNDPVVLLHKFWVLIAKHFSVSCGDDASSFRTTLGFRRALQKKRKMAALAT